MDIEAKLREIIRGFDESIDVDSLNRDSSLEDDLDMSSISLLYLAVMLEEEFGVDFSNIDLEELKTVGDIIDLIEAS
ncbi:MAG: acyl carrier protein [Lachnospiraceae bacterium]